MADDDSSGSGRSTLSTVGIVVGVVVVLWLALGLIHFLFHLVWIVAESAGFIALVVLILWLIFRNKSD
jgi:hypothetical protein